VEEFGWKSIWHRTLFNDVPLESAFDMPSCFLKGHCIQSGCNVLHLYSKWLQGWCVIFEGTVYSKWLQGLTFVFKVAARMVRHLD
jgi:hypothetical protein